jgi:formate dehydrogenase
MAAQRWDEPLLRDLAQAMIGASICGLGQAAPNVLLCVLKYFPDEVGAADPGSDAAGLSVSASGATATA